MLDADTKRRIDACRDILVGKVPDPKSQVEQITIVSAQILLKAGFDPAWLENGQTRLLP
jgi:hypothetical protein